MKNYKNKQGFTIIEVVLVLAIAGLIFLAIFMSLPALRISQRNTQRKSDVLRVAAVVETYKSNNQGKTPWSGITIRYETVGNNNFRDTYLNRNGEFNDPTTGRPYRVEIYRSIEGEFILSGGGTDPGRMYIVGDAECNVLDGDSWTTYRARKSKGKFVIFVWLESIGRYCQDF